MFRAPLAAAIVGLISTLALPAHAQKVGVVEVQKVMEAVPAWKTALDLLKKDFDSKKTSLEARQAELKKTHDQIEAKATVTDPKTIKAERDKFMQTAQAFQQEFMAAQQAISEREAGLKDVMLGRIERVVADVAQNGDYDYVFEAGAENAPNVLYAKKTAVITDEVIANYKKMFGDQAITATPRPKAPAGSVTGEKPKMPVPGAVTK